MKKIKLLRKKVKAKDAGITLVALVVTIIVLLILAGVTLFLAIGNNGIINQTAKSQKVAEHSDVLEAMKLEYQSYVIDQTTGATSQEFIQVLADKGIITNDTTAGKYIINVEKLIGKKTIYGHGTNGTDVYKLEEIELSTGKLETTKLASTQSVKIAQTSAEKGYKVVYYGNTEVGTFEVGVVTATTKTGSDSSNSGDAVYRGLAKESDSVQDLFFYEEITPPTGETTPGTAKVVGINLEYIFNESFGEDQTNWPVLTNSTTSGSNSQFINEMKPYVNKLVIPHEIVLNNKKYTITEVERLFEPSYKEKLVQTGTGEANIQVWGTGDYNELKEIRYSLWDSPDLTVNIIIPEGVKKFNANAEDNSWENSDYMCRKSSVKTISLPNTLEYLGRCSLANFYELETLVIPTSTIKIGEYSFDNCEKLKEITAPLGIIDIGDYDNYCWPTSIEKFTSNGGTKISLYEFYECNNLTDITIPNGVTSIGSEAFHGCSKLKDVTIPSSVTSIGDYAFAGCTSMKNIIVQSSLTNIGSYAFADCLPENITGPMDIFMNYSYYSAKNITLTSGTSIQDGLLSGYENLETIYIPDSVSSIGYGAFGGCNKLESISIPSNLMPSGTTYQDWGLSSQSVLKPRTSE